jgi:hypothetical protein
MSETQTATVKIAHRDYISFKVELNAIFDRWFITIKRGDSVQALPMLYEQESAAKADVDLVVKMLTTKKSIEQLLAEEEKGELPGKSG